MTNSFPNNRPPDIQLDQDFSAIPGVTALPQAVKAKPSYRPQALDTSVETDRLEFALLRQQSNGDRLQMSAALTQGARQLCISGLVTP